MASCYSRFDPVQHLKIEPVNVDSISAFRLIRVQFATTLDIAVPSELRARAPARAPLFSSRDTAETRI